MRAEGRPRPAHRARADRLRTLAVAQDLAAVLVTAAPDVRWLTGFSGSNAAVVVFATPGGDADGDDSVGVGVGAGAGTVLVTDGRYLEQAADEARETAVIDSRDALAGAATALLETVGAGAAVGFDATTMTVHDHGRLLAQLPGLTPTLGLVAQLRRRKDDQELACLREACRMISDCLIRLQPDIQPGVSERRLAARLALLLAEAGGDGLAFDTIVATGPNSSVPHHQPTDRTVAVGDLLTIDAGALVGGYSSDITRTFIVGADPTPDQQRLYDAVSAAAAAGRAAVTPGIAASDLDAIARRELAAAGFEDFFVHGLGHGVGLQIHEAPMIGARATDTIALGDVLTIEPGAYLPGFGGVRIEDTLAVTADGIECLTTVPRNLTRLA